MKKKLFATILLSTVALSQGAVVAGVSADSTDDKIAAQDNKINSINQQQQSAQAQVDQILRLMSCQKILLLVKNHLQIKHVVLKQLGLPQAILMRLLALDL